MEPTTKSPVFIVDDDSLYLKVLKHKLEQEPNIEVSTFSGGESALKNMAMKPEVVLLDYNLNSDNPDGKSGLDTLQQIKNMSPDTKVVMISGYDNVDYVVNSFKMGASDYILKNALAPGKAYLTINKLLHKIHAGAEDRMYSKGVKMMLMIVGIIFAVSILIQLFFPRLFN